jgi:hypothetical protein
MNRIAGCSSRTGFVCLKYMQVFFLEAEFSRLTRTELNWKRVKNEAVLELYSAVPYCRNK